jgi:hypothetical protein
VGFRADKDGWQVVGWAANEQGAYDSCPVNFADIIAPRPHGNPQRSWPIMAPWRYESDDADEVWIWYYRLADLPHITERWRLGTTRGPEVLRASCRIAV